MCTGLIFKHFLAGGKDFLKIIPLSGSNFRLQEKRKFYDIF